ncbi:hypothetical protein [Traorella massiliensis]|uniref:hypothetical protein n=1 Tax=Traorella massiliensis TaxID=1903263 RepID=UPI0023555666|nr:hypothetical protein [Traorella massiliensis]
MKTLLLLCFIFFSVFHYQAIILENQQTLTFFIEQLLPSLFLLCILVQMISLPQKTNKNSFIQKFFHMDTASFFIIIKAILLGSPAQSYMINSLLKEHKLTKSQAYRFINCTAIPSFSFMMMSLAFMTSQNTALIVFMIHIISIFILLFMTRKTAISLNNTHEPVSLYQAISFSLHTMALILAYLLITASLKTLLLIYLRPLEDMIQLFMEFSSGCAYYAHHQYHIFYILICIGFGGFCSHLQIMSGCKESELRYPDYLKFRFLHIFLNLALYSIFRLFLI